MSALSITRLYDQLSTKMGKETAENLTTFIDNKIDEGLESRTNIFATKDDLFNTKVELTKEISNLRLDVSKEIADTKTELRKEIAGTRADLGKDISDVRREVRNSHISTLRWMFIFWIGQLAALFSFIYLFIKR